MNTISLKKIHTTTTGSQHIQVNINNHDAGILYLTVEESHVLINALRVGANQADAFLNVDLDNTNGSCFDEADTWEEEA